MIDFSKFEPKTCGGLPWEVIVPEDGLIRVIVANEKIYVRVTEDGRVVSWIGALKGNNDMLSLAIKYDAADDWRAGWRPKQGAAYLYDDQDGTVCSLPWRGDRTDLYLSAIGNCYPGTPRGRALAEARAKYEPLIGQIAATDKPEAVFKYLRAVIARSADITAPAPAAVPPNSFNQLHTGDTNYLAAVRWLDSGFRLTIEEAEKQLDK